MESKFRLVICGSRTITDKQFIYKSLEEYIKSLLIPDFWLPIQVKTGGATRKDKQKSVDLLAEEILLEEFGNWFDILPSVKPDYERYHWRQAPIERNKVLANWATHGLAIWDGESTGTKHTISFLKKLNKPVKIVLSKPRLFGVL